MQKARRHNNYLRNVAPTACRRMVSGSFHSASCGSFHLSFTVLVHYRSIRSIQPFRMVPVTSRRIPPVPRYSGYCPSTNMFKYEAFTHYGSSFQTILLYICRIMSVLNPTLHAAWFGLFRFRSPLLTESLLFSFPPGTQMFQFPGLHLFRVIVLQTIRFPHSDILGSPIICISPRLFAAYHVLRLL